MKVLPRAPTRKTEEAVAVAVAVAAQQLVYYAAAVSTAVLGQSHKDNVRCTTV